MIVEATKMAGEGKLTLTGQLGDVMKESATIALNWIRAQWTEVTLHAHTYRNKPSNMTHSQLDLSIAASALEALDVHIHFPAGAVGKDGPSAGVTIVAALVSLFKNRTLKEGRNRANHFYPSYLELKLTSVPPCRVSHDW